MGPDSPAPYSPDELERRRRNLEALARDLAQPPGDRRAPAPGSATASTDASSQAPRSRHLGRWGSLGAGAVLLLSKAKFLLAFLKFGKFGGTLISMVATAWVYGRFFGAAFGVGLVGLIFVHELGHWLVLRHEGLPAGAPVFIPFVGAFIGLKGQPISVWSEYKIAIGGPVLGTAAAAACLLVNAIHPSHLWLALAYFGFFLNLFNLVPIHPLDGGRIAGAIHHGLWVVGYLIGIILFLKTFSPLLALILIFGFSSFWKAVRRRNDNPRYYAVTPAQRWIAGVSYFALVVFLILATHELHGALKAPNGFS